MQSTPKLINQIQRPVTENLNRIVKTDEGHIVLYDEVANESLLITAQEDQPTIRRLTTHNPVILDDVFMKQPEG